MNKKLAFDYNSFYTVPELIKLMFDSTENGNMYIPGFPYDENDELEYIYKCTMDWTENDAQSIITECAELFGEKEIPPPTMKREYTFADDVMIRRKRANKLREMKAPKIVIRNEDCLLAVALCLNRFSTSVSVLKKENE